MLTLASTAMRTRFEIVLADAGRDAADLRAAGEEALAEIEAAEARLSVYRPDSALATVNARAAREPVAVDMPTFALLARARELSAETGGAFDMTVGPLLALWGFAGAEGGRVPEDDEIEAARALVGMQRLVQLDDEERTVAFAAPGVRLDPGAIGKGHALERARELLREVGVRNALLHGGTSTVCALGTPPDGDVWHVALQHPTRPGERLARVTLNDGEALSVSAVHGKTFYAEGRRFGHVLDPRTGRPAERSVLAAAVLPDAADTDAVSTALLVLGPAGLDALAAAFPGACLLVAAESTPAGEGTEVHTVGVWSAPDGPVAR